MRIAEGSRSLLALLVVLLGFTFSCSRRTPEEGSKTVVTTEPERGGRLVLGIQQEPEMLNSVLQGTKYSRMINNAIYSRFVTYDDSMRLVPDLITEIPTLANGGISPDHLTYTYKLHPKAKWHDGQPLTSDDVRFTYEVVMHPEVGAETQQGFDIVDRVETPDPHTVVFHLREVYASFVADTFSDEDVLPRHLLEDRLGPQFREAPFHRAPVGSGPFRFESWVPGSHITVTRFDEYHGGAPYLDEILFKIVPDANALAVQLQAGDLDGYDNAESSQIPLLERLPGVRLYRTPSLLYEHLDFMCEHPILSDARVRRALAFATDRNAIAQHVYKGLAEPARADIHPVLPWYNPIADTLARYDPKRARALLQEAGWLDTDADGILDREGRPLELVISTTAGRPTRESIQAFLQQQWREIGVDLVIRNYNAAVLFGSAENEGRLRSGRFEVALFGWAQPPDPSAMEVIYGSRFIPPHGQNMGRFRNAHLDSLAALGTRLVALEDRIRVYQEIEAILLHEMPVIPLVWLVDVDPMTSRLRNYRPNPTLSGDTWNLHHWWLAPSPS